MPRDLRLPIPPRYFSTAPPHATARIPSSQARATQISPPTGCSANKARSVSTMAVTGWCSANHANGPGIDSVGTNAELMNGRKISG